MCTGAREITAPTSPSKQVATTTVFRQRHAPIKAKNEYTYCESYVNQFGAILAL